MKFDRRQIIAGASALFIGALTNPQSRAKPSSPGLPAGYRCQPWTKELLDRAARTESENRPVDWAVIESNVRDLAERAGHHAPPVMKWKAGPTEAHDHLRSLGLNRLMETDSASLCRVAQAWTAHDEEDFERWFEVRQVANRIMNVQAHDRPLMVPKLLMKSEAKTTGSTAAESFELRAVSAQIGWLETSMADAAAQAVANIELLIHTDETGCSMQVDNQLMVFELYESGLTATWETTAGLVCITRGMT